MSDIRVVGSIDIGHQSIKAVVARVTGEAVEVKGAGKALTRGLHDGKVVDIEALGKAVRQALDEAQFSAGQAVSRVVVTISPRAKRGSSVEVELPIKGKKVTQSDVAQIMRLARQMPAGSAEAVMHTEVHEFVVDDQGGIDNPVDMTASSLRLRGYNITAPAVDLDCVRRAVSKCNVEILRIVQEVHASGFSVLDPAERDLGVVLVSFGADTTKIAIWAGGVLVRNATIPEGGRAMTDSLAVAGPFTTGVAERVKTEYGVASVAAGSNDNGVQVPSRGRGQISVTTSFVASILEPHLFEILRVVRRELELSGYSDMVKAGTVLTGGAAALPHIDEVAHQVLGGLVRIGHPHSVTGISDLVRNPEFAAATGALQMLCESDASHLYDPDAENARTLGARVRQLLNWLF